MDKHKLRRKIANWIFTAVRTFIPLECPICENMPMDDSPNMLCARCYSLLKFVKKPACPGCGGPVTGIMDMCSSCMNAAAARPWKKAFSLYEMTGFGKELIHEFKYRKQTHFCRMFGRMIAMHLGEEIRAEKFDYIVPTPLHWFRKIQRTYNQSELLAERVGCELDLPMIQNLRRCKWTHQQAHLDQKARIKNLKDAFKVIHPEKIAGKSLLLVDDVLTTGATLAAAAQCLLDAGAKKICVLVIARR